MAKEMACKEVDSGQGMELGRVDWSPDEFVENVTGLMMAVKSK